MQIYDISSPIHPQMVVWKDSPNKQPHFQIVRRHETDGAYETDMTLNMHTGTHIDAPLHFVPDGATVESIALEQLCRPARVVDLTHVNDRIQAEDLNNFEIRPSDFLLFRTRNSLGSASQFNHNFVFIDKTAARFLAAKKIAGVGIDALGVERNQPDHETHLALLSQGIVIVEGLQLREVPAGEYFMVVAPLKLVGVEAAPARVLLFSQRP